MAGGSRSITVEFLGKDRSLGSMGRKIERQFGVLGTTFDKVGRKAGMLLAGGIGAGAYALTKATQATVELDKKQREVVTLFGQTGDAAQQSLGQVKDITQQLSEQFGVAQTTLTDGLYQAISAGVPQDNALQFMTVASKAAIAGVTDTQTAVDGLTTNINAFGLQASDAQSVADSMFTAVKDGKTTFGELSGAMQNVAPIAAQSSVSLQEVNAALAALTVGGTSTDNASTQLAMTLVALQKPTTAMSAALKKAGYSSGQAAIQSLGLQGALQAVVGTAHGNNQALFQMFGRQNAARAAMALTGKQSQQFTADLQHQQDSIGATQTAYDEMAASNAQSFAILGVKLQNLGMKIANQLLPSIMKLVDVGTKLTDWVSRHTTLTGILVGVLGGFLGILWGISVAMRTYIAVTETLQTLQKAGLAIKQAYAFWTYSQSAATLRSTGSTIANTASLVAQKVATIATTAATKAMAAGQWLLNTAMEANPIGFIVVALIALAAGLIYAYKHSETFRRIVNGAFHAVWGAIKFVWDWLKDHWKLLLAILTGPIGLAVRFITQHWADIKHGASLVKQWIVDKFHEILDFFRNLPGNLASAASGMWDGLKNAFRDTLNWIIGAWNSLHFSIPSVDTHIPGVGRIGGFTLAVPQIPKLAHGGNITGGGLAIVNDAGPELVNLPRGASVTPLSGGGNRDLVAAIAAAVASQPIVVEVDGKAIHQSLLRRKRDTRVPLGLA